jgi:hypothetical protein
MTKVAQHAENGVSDIHHIGMLISFWMPAVIAEPINWMVNR